MNKLILATNNKNKLREIREILRDTPWQVLSLSDINLDIEVVEDADTFCGNAIKKASEIMKVTGIATIADDSGISVDALDGAPGVYSARFAMDRINDGEDINLANNKKLMELMEGQTNRNAKYVCAMALVLSNGETHVVTDECCGEIAMTESGTGGFGYDPLFYLPEYDCTMAEITAEEKHKISHRGKAVRRLAKLLERLYTKDTTGKR